MSFQVEAFLPYLLAQAAEAVSADFQKSYRDRYGMLRTEWRVLFHLGVYGQMTAKGICDKASIHKTKVSRAVLALEQKRFIKRDVVAQDRRNENLSLTNAGLAVFLDLQKSAETYEGEITGPLSAGEVEDLKTLLQKLMQRR